ncbi:MAG: hypothetical protein WAM14_01775, partial [Candidatus Nitrosopolaris sp.]
MQEERDEHTPNISQRAYVIAKSLSELKASALGLLVLLLVILSGVTLNAYVPPIDIPTAKHAALFGTIVTSVGLVWYYIKGRQLDKNFNGWKQDYSEQTYILVFDTTVPQGDTTAERILSLARAIFPELRSNYIPPGIRDRIKLQFRRKLEKPQHIIVSESMNYKVGPEYSVDLALRTPDGYFIVKDFKDKVVTPEDLRHLAKILGHKFRNVDPLST